MKTIPLHLPAHNGTKYPIIVGTGVLQKLSRIISEIGSFDASAILYDKTVEDIAKDIQSHLTHSLMVSVPSGEESKSLHEVERIATLLLHHGMTRQSLLINIGGGMLTDLGGFVASTYMRGIAHINVPTTLLGMVDAAIGGKTGMNLGKAKNILGHFHHPKAVVADIQVLSSLPQEQLQEGLVEVIKMAAMMDQTFFKKLEEKVNHILNRDEDALCACIEGAVRMKAQTVSGDERDTGRRLFLNFGHTVGHALETLSGYTLSHGKAVSIGIACEMVLAGTNGAERVSHLLQRIGMPTELPQGHTLEDIIDAMRRDKKVLHGEIRYAAPKEIGSGGIMALDIERFSQCLA